MKDKILLFGGTTEGRELAGILKNAGISHTVSVATEYGEEILRDTGEEDLIVGRKDAAKIKGLIEEGGYSIVVDATHPFATVVTSEIKKACEELKMTYLRLSRNTGNTRPLSNNISYVESIDEAISELAKTKGNILLLTGSKDLGVIAKAIGDTERLYARVLPNVESIKKCNEAGLSGKQVIAMQGPFSKEMNIALIREINAEVVLTKESGKTGGYFEKLSACDECGIKAVVIKNPESLMEETSGYDLNGIIWKIAKLTGADRESFGICKNVSDNKKQITVAGIGPGSEEYFTVCLEKALEKADIIFGATTVVSRLANRGVPVVPKYRGEEIIEYLKENPGYERPIVVFSGDISLCSGAKSASEAFASNGYDVLRIAGISSVTLFAERLGLALEDVRVVSAHGRECNVGGYVREEAKLIVLPSNVNHTAKICSEILSHDKEITVGYELGTDSEQILKIRYANDLKLLQKKKDGKCIIYIESKNATGRAVCAGISDDEIIRGTVPMTKEEVRALSLRKLALTKNAVVYDVGAGTGSISLEAALTAPGVKVYSVEKNEAAIALLKANRENLSLGNIELICGSAPKALLNLPVPTHAFIGGSSGNLREILSTVFSKNEYTRIVVNCVTLETFTELISIIDEMKKDDSGIKTDIIQVGITRYKKAGDYHLADALNPVYIVTIQKEKSGGN